MNEEYLKEIYGYLGGEEYGDFKDFSSKISSDPNYNKQIFDYVYGEQKDADYDSFSKALV